jgi:hypothetical protein
MTLSGRVVCCARGYDAQSAGEFIYLPHARAWRFTDADVPLRSLTWRARYYLGDAPDPTGEPYLWHCCPYCGASLPKTEDQPRLGPPTGSGEGPEA